MNTKKLKILDLLVEVGTGERLSRIADRDKNYKKADCEYTEAVQRFDALDLTKEQRHIVIDMNDAFSAQSASLVDLAYKQGLVDGIDLITQVKEAKEKES